MISANAVEAWHRSGQAAAAAHDIVWFFTLVFVIAAYLSWRAER